MARIAIFGGSFNPVHNGHVFAAREFLRLLDLDRLIVMPAAVPPHKQMPAGSPDDAARYRMLCAAMDGIDGVEVSDLELQRGGKSYTYDTLLTLKEHFPKDEIYLLIGTDMLLSFDTWHRFEDILQLAELGVAIRSDLSAADRKAIDRTAEAFRNRYGARITVFCNDVLELSSTTVRRMLFFGCGDSYLPAPTAEIIRNEALYGLGGNYRNLAYPLLEQTVLSLHDENRRAHAVGCSRTAKDLARLYGVSEIDAERAGILHDLTKALRPQEQLRLCEHYGIMVGDYTPDQYKLLHGKTAAAAAEKIFGENEAVCSAISWHTTGKADMTLLEKIIYIADYIEPNRKFDGVEELRRLAYTDLDAAVLLGIDMTIDLLRRDGRSLNRYSLEAQAYLRTGRKHL
ncbi:MAG: nicotinate (nicotinamide) nucleotide adenylyltransferase [Oscillospiraceae bacterium]|nr:nicotinate (nicotinamide) nucleotide adenylyltransferase [Oscillospiraceae bacterium]